MFTEIMQSFMRFGSMISSIVGSKTPHNDVAYDYNGNERYYDKSWPFLVSSFSFYPNTGAYYCTGTVNPNGSFSGTKAGMTYVSAQALDDKTGAVFRYTITNSGASDITVKSVFYAQSLYAFQSKTSTSASNQTFILMYKNLDEDIVVPAGESVFIDITLSSGDVSSVSQG